MQATSIQLAPLQRFFRLLNVDRQEILSIYLYAFFNGIVTLTLPLGIQAIINFITNGQVSTSWIVLVVIVILGVAFSGVLQILQLTISENVQQKIFIRSAFEFAYRIPRMRFEAVQDLYVPELVNRFFDTLSVQKGLSKILIDFSTATLQILLGLILLSVYHPFFILFSLVLVLIVYLIFRYIAPKGLLTSLTESKYKYEVAHWLEELARTMDTFRLAGKSDLPLGRTDERVGDYIRSRKAHFKNLVVQFIYLVGFKVIIAAGLLLIGGLLVINQQMNIGQFVASEIVIILVLASVEKLILSMETIYDVLTAIEKIGGVADISLEKDDGAPELKNDHHGLQISMEDLSYKFKGDNHNKLDSINLKIKPGEKICISGEQGSGKTFLLQVLAGLYEEYDGFISINALSLNGWCKEDLRLRIGHHFALDDIFEGTILENIILGRDIDSSEIQQVLEAVGLSDYVRHLPKGLNTMLGTEGRNLPGSLRLKILLARCIAGDPGLILLDDSFNQMVKNDRDRFLGHVRNSSATVVVVSNLPDVAKSFEKIVVLKDGKKLDQGHYDELSNNSWFNELYQLN